MTFGGSGYCSLWPQDWGPPLQVFWTPSLKCWKITAHSYLGTTPLNKKLVKVGSVTNWDRHDLERQNNIKLQDFKQSNVRLYMWRVSASLSCLNVCWGKFSLFVTVQVSISYMLELIYNFHQFIHLRHEETNHDFPLMNMSILQGELETFWPC